MRKTALWLAAATAALALAGPVSAGPDDPPGTTGIPPAAPDPPPSISGAAQAGSTLTGDQGTWENGVQKSSQWLRCDGSGCAATGQTGATYTLTSADEGRTIKLRVTGSTMLGSREADSEPTATVAAAPPAPAPEPPPPAPSPPVNTAPPTIKGTPREGSTLSASPGGWSGSAPIAYSYEWFRCTSACVSTGRRGTAYRLSAADVGRRVGVVVTATNAAGSGQAAAAAGPIAALPAPPATSSLLSPFPVVVVGGRVLGASAVITQFLIRRAPSRALVRIGCRGRGCPYQDARRRVKSQSRLRIRSLERRLRAGTVITVTVRKGEAIGKYTRIRIRRGGAPSRVDRCVAPGSRRLIPCPDGS